MKINSVSVYFVVASTDHLHEALSHIYPFLIDLSTQLLPRMNTAMYVSITASAHKDHDPIEQSLVFHFFFCEGILELPM